MDGAAKKVWIASLQVTTQARDDGIASLVFELERDVHLGAVRLDLALGVELQIELDDLSDTEVAQGFSGAADRRGCGLLPGFLAGANQLDDLVDALRHVGPPVDVRQDAGRSCRATT